MQLQNPPCTDQLAGHTSMQSDATTDAWEEEWHTIGSAISKIKERIDLAFTGGTMEPARHLIPHIPPPLDH